MVTMISYEFPQELYFSLKYYFVYVYSLGSFFPSLLTSSVCRWLYFSSPKGSVDEERQTATWFPSGVVFHSVNGGKVCCKSSFCVPFLPVLWPWVSSPQCSGAASSGASCGFQGTGTWQSPGRARALCSGLVRCCLLKKDEKPC